MGVKATVIWKAMDYWDDGHELLGIGTGIGIALPKPVTLKNNNLLPVS